MALSLLINVVLVIILAIIGAVKWGHKDIRVPRFRRRPLQRGDVVWCKECEIVTEITKFSVGGPFPFAPASLASVIRAEHEGKTYGLSLSNYKRVSKKVEKDYWCRLAVAKELKFLRKMVFDIVKVIPAIEFDVDLDTHKTVGVKRAARKKDAKVSISIDTVGLGKKKKASEKTSSATRVASDRLIKKLKKDVEGLKK